MCLGWVWKKNESGINAYLPDQMRHKTPRIVARVQRIIQTLQPVLREVMVKAPTRRR